MEQMSGQSLKCAWKAIDGTKLASVAHSFAQKPFLWSLCKEWKKKV